MNRNEAESLKDNNKIDRQTLQIFDVRVDITSEDRVLDMISEKIETNKKLWIVTPNPEFIVAARDDISFKNLLNRADLALPDGFGLVLASRVLPTKPRLKTRVSGADLVERILAKAPFEKWKVGIVGARRGEKKEADELVLKLKDRYKGLEIRNIDESDSSLKGGFDIVFACQGMKKQEEWIYKHLDGKSKVFIGIGGALDFFAGFTRRAPVWVRKIGLEWFWRLILEPWRWRRQLNLIKFMWQVMREKLK